MEHDIDFFRDEVRNGFYIPTAIKQAWAAALDVLGEIDRICTKYQITYFADWGSLLGAVRHGGFVPWDDDLDICMKREDYIRFRQLADNELPEQYVIHDYAHKEDHWLFLARVVSNAHICFEEEHLKKYHNFPWMTGVDIFIKDYLYEDREQEEIRDKEILYLITIADGIREGEIDSPTAREHLSRIASKYQVSLPIMGNTREISVALYSLAEQQMMRVPAEESNTIGQIFPQVLKGDRGNPKHYYDEIIRLPFEDTTIPVPAAYHELLKSRYGNYLEVRKVWDGHKYPYFEGQKEIFEKQAGITIPEFLFQKDMLERRKVDKSNSLKTIAAECLQQLRMLAEEAELAAGKGDLDEKNQALAESQQLAIDLGTLIEQVKGEHREGTKAVVGVLERYCEAVYLCAQKLERKAVLCGTNEVENVENGENTENSEIPLTEVLADVEVAIQKWIIGRKEVLLLPIGPVEWKGLQGVYESLKGITEDTNAADPDGLDADICVADADVYVVPLPVLPKDPYGQVLSSGEEIQKAVRREEYPSWIELTDWNAYDPGLHCPDAIYIQNPYDGENPYLTVPSEFFARNLQQYTEKLVYIPFAATAEFGAEDVTDQSNMKYYVTAPGVIYADQVIVQSENMKEQYVRKLTEFAGADTERHWREKTEVSELPVVRCTQMRAEADATDAAIEAIEAAGAADASGHNAKSATGRTEEQDCDRQNRRRLLYCIGLNELAEHGEKLLDAVEERAQVMEAQKDKIQVTAALYPSDREKWHDQNEELTKKLFALLDSKTAKSQWSVTEIDRLHSEDMTTEYDAYYGSASLLVPMFVQKGKPVMIADYGI